jgi:hypothetical protein
MKTIIIDNEQQEILKFLNENITVFSFIHHVKDYLKNLLKNPVYAKPDSFLIANDLNGEKLKKHLEDSNIIIKNTKIETHDGKDKFCVSYTISSENIERKLRRLYSKLFENNIIESTILSETDCGGAMQGGGGNPEDGQYEKPLFGKPLRRKTVYITKEQYNKLQEEAVMDTAFGDFGYDAPPFKKKKDPAYDHKNMIKKSFNNE